MSEGRVGETKGLFIVVSAPSGAGKTTILRKVLKICPNVLFSVSYTTRPPRPGEEDGREYCFVTEEAFRERIIQGEFAEWEEYSGYLYGTSAKTMKAFLEKGFDLMLDIEPRGAKALKKNYPGGVFVFILPPSINELRRRLNQRGSDNKQVINERMNRVLDEIREVVWYDYVIFNDRLESAVDQLRSIYVAEKHKRERLAEKIQDFLV
ncbi:MAG: guanylate kinase [Deltaproteobacteria bacterium]|nr:guanylate kinase [Deltaproteobacteria bacterium]